MKTQSDINNLIANMQEGESLVRSVKKSKGTKVRIELAEKIVNPTLRGGNSNELVQLVNESDDRFNTEAKALRAWLSGEPTDVAKYFPALADAIDTVVAGGEGTEVLVGALNLSHEGNRLRVQVIESTTPDKWQAANPEKAMKTAGDGGAVIRSGGLPVYRKTTVVTGNGEINHTWVKGDTVAAPAVASAPAAAVAEASPESQVV